MTHYKMIHVETVTEKELLDNISKFILHQFFKTLYLIKFCVSYFPQFFVYFDFTDLSD